VVIANHWVIHDTTTQRCLRARSTIRLFASEPEADAVAEHMNTAQVVCVACHHKTLLAESEHKVCARCRRG
jgi:hypothetical protein